MRKQGVQAAILGLACVLAAHASAAELMSLPGLEAPHPLKPARRKAAPKRTAQPPALRETPPPRLEPASKASPGKYTGRYFLFETLPEWKGPLAVEAGVKYVPPEGEASVSIRFIPVKHRMYRTPEEMRRWLREKAAINDSHMVETVKIGKRFASRVRFTTYLYGGRYLFGKERSKRYNEMIVVPVAAGAFLIHYEAGFDVFDTFRPGYLVMLKTLTLPPEDRYQPEEHYLKRRDLLRPLIEDRVDKDTGQHRDRNDWYGHPYRFVAQFGIPVGATVSGRSLSGGKVIVLGGLREINEVLSLGSSLVRTGYSGVTAIGLDLLVVHANLMKQKPVTPYFSFTGGLEQVKLDGGSSTGTVFSLGAGAAMRWKPNLDATMELRYRNSALDGKAVAGTIHSPQLLLGLIYYFGKS